MNILRKPVKRRKFYDCALLEDMLKRLKYFQDRDFNIGELTQISNYLIPYECDIDEIIVQDSKK